MKALTRKLFSKAVETESDQFEEEPPEGIEGQENESMQDADHWDAKALDAVGPHRGLQFAYAFGGGLGGSLDGGGMAVPMAMPSGAPVAPMAVARAPRALAKRMCEARMAPAAAPMVAAAAMPQMAQAPGGGAIGFKTGGAQDAANFRENVASGYLPQPADVTYEGVVKSYFFDTSTPDAPPCTDLFCPTYSLALATDPLLAAPTTHAGSGNAYGQPEEAQHAQHAQRAPQEVFLAVGLDSGITDFRRPRLNLAILVDISGSMSCPFNSYYYDAGAGRQRELGGSDARRSKMDVAAEVVAGMLGKLGPEDSVAITVFNTAAATPKLMGRWGSADTEGIRAGVRALGANGGTNFQAGYDEATKQLRGFPACIDGDPATTENRIVVLTDAETNCGDITEEGLLARLKANAADRIHTTIVGVGLDFNSGLVEQIMKTRGANYFSVHSPGEFKQRLEEEFDFAVSPLVFDLELRVDPASLAPPTDGAAPAAVEAPLADPSGQEGAAASAQQEQPEREDVEEGWELAEREESQPLGGAGGDPQPPAAAPGSLPASPAVPAVTGGWKVVHVYGSPDSEERRLSGGGSIMRIHTLFPSAKTEEGIKGGVVLLRMLPPLGTSLATAPPLRLEARFCDRSGKQFNVARTVQVPAGASGGATFYESSGVRKAVALARLVDALQCWLTDEWAAASAHTNTADSWQAAEVAGITGHPGPLSASPPRPSPPRSGNPATAGPCMLRPGCALLPPSAHADCPACPPQLGRWERQSRRLGVNPDAKAALALLLPYIEAEVAALGDADMQQEVDLLRKLAGQ